MYKPFASLSTIEVASLTSEQIQYYTKETGSEIRVLEEVARCQKILSSIGITFPK